MTYTFFSSADGIFFIYDTASGAVIRANELEAYLCDALDPCGENNYRLPEKCPSEIRYELARFSSTEVSSAYEKIKNYFSLGLIYGNSLTNHIRTSGEYSADQLLIPLLLTEAGLKLQDIEFLS